MAEYVVEEPSSQSASWRVHERIVRCKNCKHGHKGGTLCNFFETWFPIAGGDEYEFMPSDVEPDGFCAWGERKEVNDG